jgi:hypothetical protein
MQRLEAITCGIVDENYQQALYGTHHAMFCGRTLCGLTPRDTARTVWFGKTTLREGQANEAITCKRCRKSLKLEIHPGHESRVTL